MKRYHFFYFIALFTLLPFSACETEHDHSEETEMDDIHTNHVHLSDAQQELAGIELGKAVQRPVANTIGCTAYVDVPPTSLASVYSPVEGIVQTVRHLPGEYVKKGTILTRIQHPNLVILQQDFIESQAQLTFLQQDAERKATLAEAEATSARNSQEAQAKLAQQQAHLKGLRAQLQLLGINANDLAAGGDIQSSIALHAPITGYLTEVNVNQGQLVAPTDLLYEMVDNTHKHLELNIFAKDLHLLHEHQRIEAYVPGNGQHYEAEVHLIGKRVDPKDKSIRVHGHFTDEPLDLLPGTYLQARIFTDETLAWTVPETAIVRQGAEAFVYAQEEDGFEPIAVEIDATRDSFAIIRDAAHIQDKTLVLRGAYYLQEGAESGHSH